MTENKLVVNRAQCLRCGEILISKYTHDFVTCSCGSLSVDGGQDYLKRCYNNDRDVLELSLYQTSPWEEIRSNVFRGSRGVDGIKLLTWVALSDIGGIDDEYLDNLIKYKEDNHQTQDVHYWAYCKEKEYRQKCKEV